jgi:RNA polymerase sigma-70 factor, ECF subfamily
MPLNDLETKKLYSSLMGYAYSICKNKTLSQDLVQDTFIKHLDQNHDNLAFDNIKFWCMRVLKNRFNDIMKKKGEIQFDPDIPEDQNYEDQSIGINAFSNLLYNRCMEQLKPEHQSIMLENVLAGKTTAEIAEDTGRPQNTILTWLTKAKLQFKDCIQGTV